MVKSTVESGGEDMVEVGQGGWPGGKAVGLSWGVGGWAGGLVTGKAV